LSFSRVLAVLGKEFTQLLRDRLTYAMILVIPIVQLLLFGYAINNDPRSLPTAVLVQDHGTFARSVLGAMERSEYFEVVQDVRSPEEMRDLLQRGRIQFAVTIPGDFTRRVVRGENPRILVEADASDPAALPDQALMHDLRGPLAVRAGGAAPFEVVVHRRYNPENETSFNIVPGLVAIVLSITLVMMTALGVTRELERGTMEGLLATPVRPLEVMIGKLAPYVLVGLLQATVILTMARFLFDVPAEGGWLALAAGLFLFIVASLSLGFLISTVARNQLQAMQMSFFYMLPSILLSGFMFPFAGMPMWAQYLGSVIPVTHMLRIVRGSMLKGAGIAESLPSLAALCGFLIVVATLAVARYRTTLD
jgi:ABC-2 type transport system permease protein